MKFNTIYNNVHRVQDTFNTFITALVEESVDKKSCSDGEVKEFIDKFCDARGRYKMGEIWKCVSDFLNDISSRYELRCYNNGKPKNFLRSNNLDALNKQGVDFYIMCPCPYVEIYDEEEKKVIITLGSR